MPVRAPVRALDQLLSLHDPPRPRQPPTAADRAERTTSISYLFHDHGAVLLIGTPCVTTDQVPRNESPKPPRLEPLPDNPASTTQLGDFSAAYVVTPTTRCGP